MFDKFNDECAIFGIAGHSEAANLAYLGLYAMQHRGQESAGIAAADGTRVVVSKEMGYVADIFNSARLATLTGESAIGHTRYSTAGESGLDQRAADPDRLRARADCHRAQRQPRERAGAARPSRADGIDLPDVERHRGHPAPLRAVSRGHDRGRDRRVGPAGARRLLPRDSHEGQDDRGARPARVPAAGARQARRLVGGLLRDLRARPDRRDLRARRRARRAGGDAARTACARSVRS